MMGKCSLKNKKQRTWKKIIFNWHLEGHWRKYQDPEPDSYQNFTDPQHWLGKQWED